MTDDVTPDGSPIPVYLAVPAEPEFSPVLADLPPGASVLDLGCGVGRLTNVLAERGHAVTGVDVSAGMLTHLDPRVRGIESRIEDLRLGRRFDVIVLASYLVHAAPRQRRMLLQAAADHLAVGGTVLIQHRELDASHLEETAQRWVGDVHVSFRVLRRWPDRFDGEVHYRIGSRRWTQRFTSMLLDTTTFAAAIGEVGLVPVRRLSPRWTACRSS
jgi:SAM-dependent methyltransferase